MSIDITALQQQAERAFAQKDARVALDVVRQVLAAAPEHVPAHVLASRVTLLGRRMRLATHHALAALDLARNAKPGLLASISQRLVAVGEYASAHAALCRILDSSDAPTPVLFECSQQLGLIGCHEQALAALDCAVARGGDTPATAHFRGNYLKFMGQFAAAEAAFERSIDIDPGYSLSHWSLAFLGLTSGAEQRANRVRDLLTRSSVGDLDRCFLEYALFRELETAGDTDGAWRALAAGFRRKRSLVRHDRDRETSLFDQIIRHFNDVAPEAKASTTPIFIVGMPRTGTTLLERILGNSPNITLCGELSDLRKQYRWVVDDFGSGHFDPSSIARAPTADYALLGERYLEHVRWRAPGAAMFTDKNPGNFQMIGVILKALPQAKIIHLRRDPLDACFSNLKELFAANAYSYSYDLGELAAHHRNYTRLMAHWHAIAPGRVLDVRYEDLVSEPEVQTERVMRYLGLPSTPGQSRIEDSTQIVSTASSAQVREPIHRRNIGGWQRYAAHLQPLVEALGAG